MSVLGVRPTVIAESLVLGGSLYASKHTSDGSVARSVERTAAVAKASICCCLPLIY